MRNDFKLELKVEHMQGGKDLTFYRYRYETCIFWFSQDQTNGHINRVHIYDEQYDDTKYYSYDTEDRSYPTDVAVTIPRSIVKK